MLSFLLKQILSGIDDFLLNFFAIFASIVEMQVTVGLQVSTGLQQQTCWELFVAGTILRHPEPTKESVELTILIIIVLRSEKPERNVRKASHCASKQQ